MKVPSFNFTASDISDFVKSTPSMFPLKYEYDIQWVANVLIIWKNCETNGTENIVCVSPAGVV